MNRFMFACGIWMAAFFAAELRAGTGESTKFTPSESVPVSWESQFRFSIVGESDFTDGPHDFGGVSSLDFKARVVASLPVSTSVLLRAGVDWEQTHFDAPDALRIPNSLQGASLVLGADLQLGEAWIFRIEVQPGFYGGETSLRGDDFNAPITLGASYFVSADLQLVAGVSIDANRKYPVLPGVGLRWKVASDWVINAILPNPRLEYTVTDSVLLYAGADIRVGTYRMGSDFGNGFGEPKLNEAVADYTQIRAGIGAAWQISPAATVELEAGFVPTTELNYHRAEYRIRSDDYPPYGGINVKLKF
jgi:hypothetical protein